MNTHIEKTLQILQEAGETGVHSFELNRRVGTFRAAARINDLKDRGYRITTKPEMLGNARGVRYFLNASPVEANKNKTKYVFDAIKQVYVEIKDGVQPQKTSNQLSFI